MPVYLQNKEIDKVYLGDTQIDKIYKGNTLIYSAWEDGVLFTEGKIWEGAGQLIKIGRDQAGLRGVQVLTNEDHIHSQANHIDGMNSGADIGFEKPIDVTNYKYLKALVDYNFPEWSLCSPRFLSKT